MILWLALTAQAGPPSDTPAELDALLGPAHRTFAMKQVLASQVKDPNPVAPKKWGTSTTTAWLLVDLTRSGHEVQWTERLCDLESNKLFGTTTEYPEAFVESIPTRKVTAGVRARHGTASLQTLPQVQLLGLDLDEPATEDLPTEADDPRVVDVDGDGHPGATVKIHQALMGRGEVYVAQRAITSLSGTWTGPDSLEGTVDQQVEQVALDASTWWLKLEARTRPHPDPAASRFEMKAIAPDSTCEDVLSERERLFGDAS